jgi:hypothetical protein
MVALKIKMFCVLAKSRYAANYVYIARTARAREFWLGLRQILMEGAPDLEGTRNSSRETAN